MLCQVLASVEQFGMWADACSTPVAGMLDQLLGLSNVAVPVATEADGTFASICPATCDGCDACDDDQAGALPHGHSCAEVLSTVQIFHFGCGTSIQMVSQVLGLAGIHLPPSENDKTIAELCARTCGACGGKPQACADSSFSDSSGCAAGDDGGLTAFNTAGSCSGTSCQQAECCRVPDPPSPPPAQIHFGATRVDTSGTTNEGEINAAGDEAWFAFHAVAGVSCFLDLSALSVIATPRKDRKRCGLAAGHTYQLDTHIRHLDTLPDSVMELYDIDGSTLLVENDDDPRLTEQYGSYIEWSEFRTRSCSMEMEELHSQAPGLSRRCCATITLTAALHRP